MKMRILFLSILCLGTLHIVAAEKPEKGFDAKQLGKDVRHVLEGAQTEGLRMGKSAFDVVSKDSAASVASVISLGALAKTFKRNPLASLVAVGSTVFVVGRIAQKLEAEQKKDIAQKIAESGEAKRATQLTGQAWSMAQQAHADAAKALTEAMKEKDSGDDSERA